MDNIPPPVRSRVMGQIRSRGNRTTEIALIGVFRQHAITGWRRGVPLIGKPDFVFPICRVVVFVDGCFWHGCRSHCRTPHTRRKYWTRKVRLNQERDTEVTRMLRTSGWSVFRFWEHDVKAGCKTHGFKRMKTIIQQSAFLVRDTRGGSRADEPRR